MIPDDLRADYDALIHSHHGPLYLLSWLVGAINDTGRADVDTLRAAMPLAKAWGERWTEAAS